ncbi:MAG: ferrochelatase [Alphaproteobacteria bacterium]
MINRPADHPTFPAPKVGVLLVNLGTPDGTDYWSMRRYLGEFLSDKRVIDAPSWKWQPILQGIILTLRPSKSGEAYRSIWNNELDESPLLTITRAQTEKVAVKMANKYGDQVIVDFCMRYGNPSTDSKIRALKDQGCDKIVFFPLYPQYAAPTTATANDQAFRTLMKMNWQPAFRTVPAYFDNPLYLESLANSVREGYAGLAEKPDHLVVSYHGVPERYLLEGDPYHCQCQKSTRLLAETLGWDADHLITAFQSKFGPTKWVGPATVDEVARLAQAGKQNIAIIAPAFSADCVETLEEVNEEIRESFEGAGGETFSYFPCLNDREDHIEALFGILETEMAGWVQA